MNELIIPYDSLALIEEGRASIVAHKREVIKRIESATALLSAATYRKERLNAFDAEIKAITAASDALAEKIALVTHCKELFVELAAAKNAIAAAVKARQERIYELKAANEPKEPVHSYVIRLNCTDALLSSLIKKAVKDGAEEVLATSPQSDKAVKQIGKWFEENV